MTEQTTKRRNTTPRLTFYCPENLQNDLKTASEELGLTVSELLRIIVEEYLDVKLESNQISRKSHVNNVNELIKTFGEKVLLFAYRDLRRIKSVIQSDNFNKEVKGTELDWDKTSHVDESNPLIDKLIGEEMDQALDEAYLAKNAEIIELEEKIKQLTFMRNELFKEIMPVNPD